MTATTRQCGAVLILSLILLVLLAVLGVVGTRMTGLEERKAGNLRQRNLAFQAAESALLDAELFVQGNDSNFKPLRLSGGPFQGADCAGGLCPATNPPKWSLSGFDWVANGRSYSGTIQGVAQQPRYVLELLGTEPTSPAGSPCYATFRITAMGWGDDLNARVQLQSIFILNATSCL